MGEAHGAEREGGCWGAGMGGTAWQLLWAQRGCCVFVFLPDQSSVSRAGFPYYSQTHVTDGFNRVVAHASVRCSTLQRCITGTWVQFWNVLTTPKGVPRPVSFRPQPLLLSPWPRPFWAVPVGRSPGLGSLCPVPPRSSLGLASAVFMAEWPSVVPLGQGSQPRVCGACGWPCAWWL